MSTTRRGTPAAPEINYHRDTGTLSVSIRHKEADGVTCFTSSYATSLEMSVTHWRAYLAAVLANVDEVAPETPIGPQQFVPHDLAERIAEHAAAT